MKFEGPKIWVNQRKHFKYFAHQITVSKNQETYIYVQFLIARKIQLNEVVMNDYLRVVVNDYINRSLFVINFRLI